MGDLLRILRDSELDRDSKLRVIEIVSMSQDQELVNDLIDVLKRWDAGDNMAEAETLADLRKIEAHYRDEMDEIERKTSSSLERIEDEVEKEDGVGDIKKSILEK